MKTAYKIGTVYKSRGKFPKTFTVVDIHTTLNNANEIVKISYVSSHIFAGQEIIEKDVCETTISMGLIAGGNNEI